MCWQFLQICIWTACMCACMCDLISWQCDLNLDKWKRFEPCQINRKPAGPQVSLLFLSPSLVSLSKSSSDRPTHIACCCQVSDLRRLELEAWSQSPYRVRTYLALKVVCPSAIPLRNLRPNELDEIEGFF